MVRFSRWVKQEEKVEGDFLKLLNTLIWISVIIFLIADWQVYLWYFDTGYYGYEESEFEIKYGDSTHMAFYSIMLVQYELFRWFFRVQANFEKWSDYRAEWMAKLKQDDPAGLNEDGSEMPGL